MVNLLEIPTSRLYALPFEKDSLKLTLETINSNSNFDFTKFPSSAYEIRKISFQNEFLTIGILFHFEKEERIYLKITQSHLLVSCSVDTDSSYLSRYAYFALIRLMSIYQYQNFDNYYWPDFFDKETGVSKYLEIINDRKGFDIFLKDEYSYFLKPNDYIYYPSNEASIRRPKMLFTNRKALDNLHKNGLGFCIADTYLFSWHSNHFPFLISYRGTLTADKKKIKAFLGFIITNGEGSDYTPVQIDLCKMSRRMGQIAQIVGHEIDGPQYRVNLFDDRNLKRFKELFHIWQDAIIYLPFMPHTHHLVTFGFKNIKMKPKKTSMIPCRFSEKTPKICFLWIDHGDYYELSYRFKVGEEIYEPMEKYTAFFIRSEGDSKTFYLFDNIADCLLTIFFGERRFKIFILKAHYEKHFAQFVDALKKKYDFVDCSTKTSC